MKLTLFKRKPKPKQYTELAIEEALTDAKTTLMFQLWGESGDPHSPEADAIDLFTTTFWSRVENPNSVADLEQIIESSNIPAKLEDIKTWWSWGK
ncbi:hypothetical protein ABZ543_13285 [Streptomyces roseifaciens]